MKNMNPEIFATLSIIFLCWIFLLISDAAVCGLLKMLFGIRFRKAFMWGLLSLQQCSLPPLFVLHGFPGGPFPRLLGRGLERPKC